MKVKFKSHEHGIQFELGQEEINEILLANGWTPVEEKEVGPCGLTNYYRVEQNTTNQKTKQIHNATYILGQIWKTHFMEMMTK